MKNAHKINPKITTAVALAVSALLFNPAVASTPVAGNLAIVNGKAIPLTRLEAFIAEVGKSGTPITAEIKNKIKEELIKREMFAQEADRKGLGNTDEFKLQIESARQQLLIRQYFTDYQKNNKITDADVKAEYDRFLKTNSGKEYKAHHILVEKEADAKATLVSLKKGEKFDVLAKKISKDTGSGVKGGELDWANPANYVPEFSAALIKLAKGQTTEVPVKTQFGYHIIRLDDVRTAQLPKMEELKPQIMQELMQQRIAKLEQDLRAKSKIE